MTTSPEIDDPNIAIRQSIDHVQHRTTPPELDEDLNPIITPEEAITIYQETLAEIAIQEARAAEQCREEAERRIEAAREAQARPQSA